MALPQYRIPSFTPIQNRLIHVKILTTSKRPVMLASASVASYGYVPSSPILVTLMMEALSSSEK
jgi:hypothetical protein